MIFDRRTAQKMWTPPSNVVPLLRRPTCAQVNFDTSLSILRDMTEKELNEHISSLDAEHQLKMKALNAAREALARALSERIRRRG